MSASHDREILNISEAAELLGVSPKTFNKVLRTEPLPARKIGREWKFSRQALIDWLGAGVSTDYYKDVRAPQNGARGVSTDDAGGPESNGL